MSKYVKTVCTFFKNKFVLNRFRICTVLNELFSRNIAETFPFRRNYFHPSAELIGSSAKSMLFFKQTTFKKVRLYANRIRITFVRITQRVTIYKRTTQRIATQFIGASDQKRVWIRRKCPLHHLWVEYFTTFALKDAHRPVPLHFIVEKKRLAEDL